MHRLHFYLAVPLLITSTLWGPAGCGHLGQVARSPVTVRENPSSYTPHYSPRVTSTSSSGGGWSSGK